ncbi:hypothetical protein [Streptomyces sp. NRRL F-2799]|uniref:glycosyltransferase family 9 protein n=1 Tax=Streptomyces sp. NRRL F-2799 TaxID=1463844 RepID=UPI000AFA0A0D|nr:hypothetical protein [Streptomyces sp. NRRL F-2799]
MTPPPDRPHVLVLRALGLGDLLAGVPALRGIRRAFPAHRVVLALPPALTDAALVTGTVDAVLPAEAPGRAVPTLTHWAGPPPDLAIDLHGNGPESRDALADLHPRHLLAHAHRGPAPGRPPRLAGRRARTGALVPLPGRVRHPRRPGRPAAAPAAGTLTGTGRRRRPSGGRLRGPALARRTLRRRRPAAARTRRPAARRPGPPPPAAPPRRTAARLVDTDRAARARRQGPA